MSNNGKIKVYKNPARNSVDQNNKPYVPQYQLMGVEPEEYKSPVASGYHIAVQKTPNSDNEIRGKRPAIRQPYAEAVPSPVGRGRGLLPNVGNNMEQTWSSVDSEIIDNISDVDLNQPLIDNNEFVTAEALNISENDVQYLNEDNNQPLNEQEKYFLTKNDLQNHLTNEDLPNILKELEEDNYLILVSGSVICYGSLEEVEEEATKLVFGEHQLFLGNPISADDILIIKRIKLKVGVFLE
jgi:hypothetical protein